MNRALPCLALAGCVFLTGCISNDARPDPPGGAEVNYSAAEHYATDESVYIPASASASVVAAAQQTTASAGLTEASAETEEIAPVVAASSAASSVTVGSAAPVTEVTTTPDAETDLNVFYDETHEKFDLSEDELGFLDYTLIVGDSICSGFSEYGIVPSQIVAAKGNLGARSFFDYTFRFRGRDDQTYEQVMKAANPRYVLLSMGMNDVNMVTRTLFVSITAPLLTRPLQGQRRMFLSPPLPLFAANSAETVL